MRGKGAAVAAQRLEQARAQNAVAVGAALACVDAHAHPVTRAVDVRHAQPGGVDGLQRHAVRRVRAAGKEARNLLASQQVRLLLRHARHWRAQAIGRSTQNVLEQEAAGAGGVVDAAV